MKKTLNIIFPAYYLFLFFLFVYAKWGEVHTLIAVAITLSTIILLFVGAIMAVKAYGLKNIHGKAITLIMTGIVIKMIAASIPYFAGTLQEISATFSIYRWIGFIAYILILIGLILELRQSKIEWTANKILTNVALVAVLSGLVIYLGIVFPGLIAVKSPFIINILFDLLVGVFAVLIFSIVREYQKGKMALPWLLLLVSFLLGIFSDVLSANFYEELFAGVWPYASAIIILSPVVMLLQAQGFFKMKIMVDEVNAELLNKQS